MKKSLKYFAILALSVIAFAACKEETPYVCEGESGDIYVKFGGTGTTDTRLLVTTDGYIGETYAVSVTYDMYTNADEWQIVPDYSECYDPEYEWITSWPSEGNYDGRFTLNFQANSRQGDTRFAKVNIVSHGQVIQTIDIEQDKAPNTQFYIQPFLHRRGACDRAYRACRDARQLWPNALGRSRCARHRSQPSSLYL